MSVVLFLVLVPASYLAGSVPWGLLVARLVKRVDVRRYGSGNIGMTNVARTAGVKAGLAVLLLDAGKGALAVGVAHWVGSTVGASITTTAYLKMACALAALVGHNWSIFIGFQGGRGTATGLGALSVVSPWSGLAAVLVGVPVVALWRYISLGSIVGAVSGGLTSLALSLAGLQPLAYGLYGAIGVPLVVWRHRANIGRLLKGEEHRVGERARPIRSAAPDVEGQG